MRRIEKTTALPLWLLTSLLVLTVARLALSVPGQSGSSAAAIDWREPPEVGRQAGEKDVDADRLCLYDFTASWCYPGQAMDRTAFRNKAVVALVNANFIPFRLLDARSGTGRNIDTLKEQFHVTAYPALVVGFADGDLIASHTGLLSSPDAYVFLKKALRSSILKRGIRSFVTQDYSSAGEYFAEFLAQSDLGQKDSATVAAWLIGTRYMLGEHKKARSLAVSWLERQPVTWPEPVFGYLSGKYSADELVKKAESLDFTGPLVDRGAGLGDRKEVAYQTRARTYAGLKMAGVGKREQAEEQLNWVIEQGDNQCQEYLFAMAALATLRKQQ